MSSLICLVAECPVTSLVWRTFVVCTGEYLHALEIDVFHTSVKKLDWLPCVALAERTHHDVLKVPIAVVKVPKPMRKVPTAMLKLLAGISPCV
jgi:hypothetical protein